MQRYAQTWSGDNYTSWKSLHWNIAMGLGLALSGVSNIGHDVGGFAGPRPEPELFLRWIGFGVFMPRFSIHSWNDDGTVNEPWMYPEHMAEVQSLMRLRERLVPYLARTLALYRETYEPAVRPLFYDFPDDSAAWMEDTAFMLGADLLAAPVVKKGATHRTLRLPKGTDWRDPWTGAVLKGGARVRLEAPFDKPPFLIRADSADAALARLFNGV
jgi:alpha-glucosidase